MTPSIGWVEIADLQMDKTDGVLSRNRLNAILAVICAHLGDRAGVVFALCANANHAPPEHDRQIGDGLASTATGGPHSRLTMRPRNGLMGKPARANAEGQAPFVFIEAYASELDAGGDTIARTCADAGVTGANKNGMRR